LYNREDKFECDEAYLKQSSLIRYRHYFGTGGTLERDVYEPSTRLNRVKPCAQTYVYVCENVRPA